MEVGAAGRLSLVVLASLVKQEGGVPRRGRAAGVQEGSFGLVLFPFEEGTPQAHSGFGLHLGLQLR